MRKSTVFLGAIILLLFTYFINPISNANANQDISIYIDGAKLSFDSPPTILNDRTLVPLRGVFENLGATVDWNKETRQAIVKNEHIEVLLEAENQGVLFNGKIQFLDTHSTIKNDRLLVPLRFVAESLGHDVKWDNTTRSVFITTRTFDPTSLSSDLPSVNDRESLSQLIKYNYHLNEYLVGRTMNGIIDGLPTFDVVEAVEEKGMESDSSSTNDHSNTNNQEEGVDEGDIVKTNGHQIFSIQGNKVHIIDSNPTKPTILSTIDIPVKNGSVSNLYIEDTHLVIIGSYYGPYGVPTPYSYSSQNTFVIVYDISSPSSPRLDQDYSFEGSYVSSRLIADKLYVVTNKYLDYWGIDIMSDYALQPKYSNNITNNMSLVEYSDIHYFPDYISPNIMMTIGLDLSNGDLDVKSYLGSAEIVYANTEQLYLTFTKYEYTPYIRPLLYMPNYSKTTSIYQFDLDDGQIIYKNTGSIPGSILNQFSLDVYDNHLRIATTTGDMWDETNISKNNVYILDNNLKEVGSLTDLAPGEQIYSTRFSGDRIYMVTYKQVDPFFVIDANNPTSPKVLGYLKIPGFSTYMHILDENHILGFGTDTTEINGNIRTGGFKISLFDVTDPTNPIEKDKEVIGIAGTYSELQNNHKSLMISLNKGLMAFPISVASSTPYSIKFSGAYVYDITTNSFDYKGNITHESTIPPAISEDGYKYSNPINRILYIGDYLYTLANNQLVVTKILDMSTVSSLVLP